MHSYAKDGPPANRVQKSNGKIYWYGAGTEILDESDASGNFTDEYVYFGGKRVAHRAVSGNSIYYYAEDFLGTSRVITTSTGTVCYESDFYPYGGERNITNTCPQNYKFEGKERDTETNNDDFGARYYSSQFGRWLSPDWSAVPAPVPYANLTNPQTLNLYAMVSDNPETFADLDGHEDEGGGGGSGGGMSSGSSSDNQSQSPQEQNAGKAQTKTAQPAQTNPTNNQTSDPKTQPSKSNDQNKPPTKLEKFLTYLGCLAGSDPENVKPIELNKKESKAPTDSTKETEGQRNAQPNDGRRRPLNPETRMSKTPDNTANGVQYVTDALSCMAYAHELLNKAPDAPK